MVKDTERKAASGKGSAAAVGKAKASAPAQPQRAVITNEVRRDWLRVRQAWNMGEESFTGTLGLLNDKQANALYDVVRFSLFKDNPAEIFRTNPEMRALILNDDDRLCMHDIYEALSRRLDRREPLPAFVAMKIRTKGGFAREINDLYHD